MSKKFLYIITLSVLCTLSAKADYLGFSKQNPLIFGLDTDYAPLEYVDQDGMPKGYDVEFTQELMKRLNIPFTYQPNTWENISGDAMTGRVDLAMMVYSPYRKDDIHYSHAVFRLYYQIIYRVDDTGKFDLRNLEDKEIAFMKSRPIADTLSKIGAKLYEIKDLHRAMQDLSKGKYDAVICFRYQARYLIEHYNLLNLKTEDVTLMSREYCYVSKNKDLIDAIDMELQLMEADGTIMQYYGGVASKFVGNIPDWIFFLFGGVVIVFMLVFILYQHKTQNKLLEQMRRAQQNERLKTVFLANVSHALRTPLNAIIGFSDVLRDAAGMLPPEDEKELLEQVHKNGRQLSYFVDELLQLSNYEGSEIQFSRTEIDLKQIIQEYYDETLRLVKDGVKLKVLTPHDECKVFVDTNHLRTVVMHLLRNAATHTNEGTITLYYEEREGGLYLSVKDTGVGVPEKLQRNIFGLLSEKETYVQSEVPGLGLSICKAIIDQCKGRLGLESEAGKGSTFWFWIPCKIETK